MPRRLKGISSMFIRPASIFEISRMSSIMASKLLARVETVTRFSRCVRESTVSRVSDVIPMIPFMGVRISCDMLAKNSDLERFASSAASRAAVFFWILSRRLYTI